MKYKSLHSLIFEGMKTGYLSGVNSISRQIHMFREFVLSNADILAGSLDAKESADGRPKLILPCDKIILYAIGEKTTYHLN